MTREEFMKSLAAQKSQAAAKKPGMLSTAKMSAEQAQGHLLDSRDGFVKPPANYFSIREYAAAEAARQRKAQEDAGGGGGCCFIFLEAEDGTLPDVVRRYRDEHMTVQNRRGYYKLAEVLVPLMRRSWAVKQAVRWLMVKPLIAYGRHHYRQGKAGRLFKPVARFWLSLFEYLGQDHPFRRENGDIV